MTTRLPQFLPIYNRRMLPDNLFRESASCSDPDSVLDIMRTIRTQAGLTVPQLAKRLNLREKTARRIERGETQTKIEHVAMWADACGVEIRIEVA